MADWLLGRDDTAPARARQAIDDWAGSHAIEGETLDDLLLVANEIVTYALQHTDGPVALSVKLAGDVLTVGVSDGGPSLPRTSDARGHALGGHGMLIVEALSTSWSVERRNGGRTVWAHLARR